MWSEQCQPAARHPHHACWSVWNCHSWLVDKAAASTVQATLWLQIFADVTDLPIQMPCHLKACHSQVLVTPDDINALQQCSVDCEHSSVHTLLV